MPITSQIHVDKALSNISIKYTNNDYIAQKVFPVVMVNKDSDKYFIFDRDFRIPETIRANRGLAREHSFKMSTSSYLLEKHALKDFVSDDDKANYDAGSINVDVTEELKDKIMLRLEKDVADLFTSTTWTNNVSLATAQKFSLDTVTSNPVPIFDTGTSVILANSGKTPNFAMIPKEVMMIIKNHVSIVDRVKYTSATIDEKIVAGLLGYKDVLVGGAQYDSAAEGATQSISNVWSDNCFVGYKPARANVRTPSCGYLFMSKAPQVKKWREEERESDAIEVNVKYDPIVTSVYAGYLIKDCI